MPQVRPKVVVETGRVIPSVEFANAIGSFVPADSQKIAIGVSGGADSMALAMLTAHWASGRNVSITALTVDHRLRADSTDEAQKVSAWLATKNIPHEVLDWAEGEVVRTLGRSAQDAARSARLALLTNWCHENNCRVLLLAHHADDQIETFFMRLARGSGLAGLGGISPVTFMRGVRLARPLLAFNKTDLIATCQNFGQAWVEDPSNANSKYARTRFRQTRALMEVEGFTRERVLATVAHLQRAKEALEHAVQGLQHKACIWTEYGSVTISMAGLFATPDEVSLRLLSAVLRVVSGHDYGPRFEALMRLHQKLRVSELHTATLHGCCLSRSGDSLSVWREASAVRDILKIGTQRSVVWDGRFEIEGAASSQWRVRAYKPEDKALWRTQGNIDGLSAIPGRLRRTLPVIEDHAGLVGMPHARLWRADSAGLANTVTFRFVGPERFGAPAATDFQAE